MKAIKQRPFAFSCILYVISSVLFFFCALPIKAAVVLLLFILETFLILKKRNCRLLILYTLPPIILSGLISIYFYSVNYRNVLSYVGKTCDLDFVVTDKNNITDSYSSYTVLIREINGNKVNFKCNISFEGRIDVDEYTCHSAEVDFSDITDELTGSSKYSFMSKNVYLSARVTDNYRDKKLQEKLFPEYYFHRVNRILSSRISKYIQGEENALIQALLLGNKDMLSEETKYNFRLLGLSHILAVSGMHLSLIIGTLDKLFEKIYEDKKKKHILMMFLTFAYAGITGFSQSVSRAALMLILYYLMFIVSRKQDSVTSLCTALGILCFISPNSMFDIGLWLSFLSTYGIVAVALPIDASITEWVELTESKIKKILLKLWSSLMFGIVPVMFSLPVIWLSYGEVSVISPVANILFTPFLLGIMYTAPFTVIFADFYVFAVNPSLLSYICARLMLLFTDLLAPYAPIVPLNYDFTPIIIILLVLSYIVLALKNVKRTSVYFVPFLCATVVFAFLCFVYRDMTSDDQKIIYSNTLYGDSFVVISNNKGLVCDISGISSLNAKRSENYLHENKINGIDAYLITDYHGRGTDTLDILTSYTRIGKLYLPYATDYEEKLLEEKFVIYAKEKGIEYSMYDSSEGEEIDFFGVILCVRNLANREINTPSSICVTLTNGNKDFAYVGAGAYSTEMGEKYLSSLFRSGTPNLFGAYGRKEKLPVTTLYGQDETELYFTSQSILNLHKDTLTDKARTKITEEYLEVWFNR